MSVGIKRGCVASFVKERFTGVCAVNDCFTAVYMFGKQEET